MVVGIAASVFGWNLEEDLDKVAKATVAGHLLECGTQLTGGFFAHPAGRCIGDQLTSALPQPAPLPAPSATANTYTRCLHHRLLHADTRIICRMNVLID